MVLESQRDGCQEHLSLGALASRDKEKVYLMRLRDGEWLFNTEKDPGLERVPGHQQEREEVSR